MVLSRSQTVIPPSTPCTGSLQQWSSARWHRGCTLQLLHSSGNGGQTPDPRLLTVSRNGTIQIPDCHPPPPPPFFSFIQSHSAIGILPQGPGGHNTVSHTIGGSGLMPQPNVLTVCLYVHSLCGSFANARVSPLTVCRPRAR